MTGPLLQTWVCAHYELKDYSSLHHLEICMKIYTYIQPVAGVMLYKALQLFWTADPVR